MLHLQLLWATCSCSSVTTLTANNFIWISNLNLPPLNLKPLLLDLSLHFLIKNLSPTSLWVPVMYWKVLMKLNCCVHRMDKVHAQTISKNEIFSWMSPNAFQLSILIRKISALHFSLQVLKKKGPQQRFALCDVTGHWSVLWMLPQKPVSQHSKTLCRELQLQKDTNLSCCPWQMTSAGKAQINSKQACSKVFFLSRECNGQVVKQSAIHPLCF